MSDFPGKGCWQRPLSTGQEEYKIRQQYAHGEITLEEFYRQYAELEKQGKITRNGRRLG